ncbi:MAG TPA: DUF4142 domain-containing protein [Ramlibacter sp.]|nr:DUF4142 domain-containing protein [Ramlibacter sp.]
MKRVGVGILAMAIGVLWMGAARAQNEADRAPPGFEPGLKPKPRPSVSRAGVFAAASVANARPSPVEQREERRFLKDAAANSRFQIEASRLAIARSQHAPVRALAAALIDHHLASLNVLQHLLHGRAMAMPMLDNDQRKVLNRLAKLQGTRFNRFFMQEVGLRGQFEALQDYERAAQLQADPMVKAWIEGTLPALRSQWATAERIVAADVKLAREPAAPVPRPSARLTGSSSR